MTPTYFIPQVQADQIPSPDDPQPRQGVCFLYGRSVLQDVAHVGADWYYDYGATPANLPDPRYVPMAWGGGYNIPALTPDYAGYLLALNEPDNAGQLNITPIEAANRIRALATVFPSARLIIGGVTYFGVEWLRKFVIELGAYRPAGWHMHGYCEWSLTPRAVYAWFRQARDMCPGGEFWVTEFADVTGGALAAEILQLVRQADFIDRYSWFANRIKGAEWFIPAHWCNPALVDNVGQLTTLGELYAEGR